MSNIMELIYDYANCCQADGAHDLIDDHETTVAAHIAVVEAVEKLEKDAAQSEAVWMDAKRLAMELECLLMSCELPACTKWWDSAHEALELHRQLLQETYAAMEATK